MTDHDNDWASLKGLMAVLALPAVRCVDGTFRKRMIEVEVSRGVWVPIRHMAIEPERIVVWHGDNGERNEYVFLRAAGVPRWRIEQRGEAGFMVSST